MIRVATLTDIPRIVELGSRSLVDGPYKNIIKDIPEQTTKLATQIIENKNGIILLYENDSKKVVGLLGFLIFAHPFTAEPTATEIVLYVEPKERVGGAGLKLMWEAEKQAKAMGATYMGFTAPTDEVGALYARFGYRRVEVTYLKEL